ncbi:MAG: glycerol-3-phosphate dehydrogenase/oxidase [Pseudomonadota bacterium]
MNPLGDIPGHWELIVIGGGITGAGVFDEAVRRGWRTLLLERRDFAWGTSSRSSKLVHGGLRYLKQGQLGLMRQAVKEREYLLETIPDLVSPIHFTVPVFKDIGPGRLALETGLSIYDMVAGRWQHRYLDLAETQARLPGLRAEALMGAFTFTDAQTDDARLVLHLIGEGLRAGGSALNYTMVERIRRDHRGDVTGIVAMDSETGHRRTLTAAGVINATGVWAETIHPAPVKNGHIRPLRGSHLIFPSRLIPLSTALSFVHPSDHRSMFIIPWEGATLVGTTDVDHHGDLSTEPTVSIEEARYLLNGVRFIFPGLRIETEDALSSFAGVRPVLSHGGRAPSDESREHRVWAEHRLVTVTGGKLTTFRRLAADALAKAAHDLPPETPDAPAPAAEAPPEAISVDTAHLRRLVARFGFKAARRMADTHRELLAPVPGTATLWAELALAAETEQIRHLDDLLLRRVRIGLLLPDGARGHLRQIKAVCQSRLGWNDERWLQETAAYTALWNRAYAPPT